MVDLGAIVDLRLGAFVDLGAIVDLRLGAMTDLRDLIDFSLGRLGSFMILGPRHSVVNYCSMIGVRYCGIELAFSLHGFQFTYGVRRTQEESDKRCLENFMFFMFTLFVLLD